MKKSKEYYTKLGLDKTTAQYFAEGRKKITKVIPNDDFSLTLHFDNNERKVFDAKPLIKKNTVFEHISVLNDFKRVYLDDNGCVSWDIDPNIDSNEVWSNKIDLCPDSCYIDSKPVNN